MNKVKILSILRNKKIPMMKGDAFHPPVLSLLAILPLKSTLPFVTRSIEDDDDDDDSVESDLEMVVGSVVWSNSYFVMGGRKQELVDWNWIAVYSSETNLCGFRNVGILFVRSQN